MSPIVVCAGRPKRLGRNTVALSDMPRHVALIGEARLESDLRKGQRASAQKRHRPLDAGEHDVAMRRMSRRAGEGPAEMERAEAGDVGH